MAITMMINLIRSDHQLHARLLEINSSPALGATTSVTSRLCSAVLEDVVKVDDYAAADLDFNGDSGFSFCHSDL